jgi:hypothetical protein
MYKGFCVECGAEFIKDPYHGGPRPLFCNETCSNRNKKKKLREAMELLGNPCQCGCGRKARRKWSSDACRQRIHNARRDPAARRAYALERLARNSQVAQLPTIDVMATVHRANDDDDIDVVQRMVRVPVPTYGLWGY